MINREILKKLKKEYPIGARVELVKMDDPQAPSVGTTGKVNFIDDAGTIHVSWENGSNLGIVYGEDICRVTK